jgi:hypothetical protein
MAFHGKADHTPSPCSELTRKSQYITIIIGTYREMKGCMQLTQQKMTFWNAEKEKKWWNAEKENQQHLGRIYSMFAHRKEAHILHFDACFFFFLQLSGNDSLLCLE